MTKLNIQTAITPLSMSGSSNVNIATLPIYIYTNIQLYSLIVFGDNYISFDTINNNVNAGDYILLEVGRNMNGIGTCIVPKQISAGILLI